MTTSKPRWRLFRHLAAMIILSRRWPFWCHQWWGLYWWEWQCLTSSSDEPIDHSGLRNHQHQHHCHITTAPQRTRKKSSLWTTVCIHHQLSKLSQKDQNSKRSLTPPPLGSFSKIHPNLGAEASLKFEAKYDVGQPCQRFGAKMSSGSPRSVFTKMARGRWEGTGGVGAEEVDLLLATHYPQTGTRQDPLKA